LKEAFLPTHDRIPESEDTRTLHELAREALLVQDACNPLGVSRSFARALRRLNTLLDAEGQGGTRALCEHPVAVAWASKIASLHSVEHGMTAHNALSTLMEWTDAQR
jgi:hypothetical protein